MRAANTCLIWATVLSCVFLGLVLDGAVPSYAASPYTLEQFLPSPECTSVDISPDRTCIYARTMFGDWDEGARAFSFSSYAQIRDYHAFDVPWCILTSADNLYLYGSHYYGGLVDKVSVATDTVIRSVDVGDWTGRMAFDAARRFLYVNENTPGTGSVGSIKVIDTSQATMPVVGSIGLDGEPGCFPVVSPDGANVYANSWNAGKLYRISTSDYTIKKTYSGLSQNSFVSSLSADGSKVYVADRGPGLVRVLDAVNLTQLETYSIPGISEFSVSPTGRYALALTGTSVQVFDMTSKSVVQTIATPTSNASAGRIVWDAPTGKAYVPLTAADGGVAVLAPQPQLYGVYIGSDQWDWIIPKLRGQADADAIEAKFHAFSMWNGSTSRYFDYKERGDNSRSVVFFALASYEDKVAAGDTFVFFYAGHGGGGLGQNEWLAINRDQAGDSDDQERMITDDELASWFLSEDMIGARKRKDIWAEVNKLFILDACNSGGFGTSDDGVWVGGGVVWEDDLMGLSHAAILAACAEDKDAYSRWDGRGEFTLAVEKALTLVSGYARADSDKNGLTFDELDAYLAAYVADNSEGFDGYIRLDPAGDDLQAVPGTLSLYSWVSADYDGVIPEPATFSLLALGGLAVLRRHRR